MTLADIKTRIYQRLDDDPGAPVRYVASDVVGAVNRGLRLLAFLSLYKERGFMLPLNAATAWYRLYSYIPDFLLPLRLQYLPSATMADANLFGNEQFGVSTFGQIVSLSLAASNRLRPATLTDLDALDEHWQASPGSPTRYGVFGFDLMYLHQQPADPAGSVAIWYAAAPETLALDGDVPDCPEEYQANLIDFALCDLAVNDGGSVLARHAAGMAAFIASANRLGAYVRARGLSYRFDKQPAPAVEKAT